MNKGSYLSIYCRGVRSGLGRSGLLNRGAQYCSFDNEFLLLAPVAALPKMKCVTLTIGGSSRNWKAVYNRAITSYKCPTFVTKGNWIGGHTYPDRFIIVIYFFINVYKNQSLFKNKHCMKIHNTYTVNVEICPDVMTNA